MTNLFLFGSFGFFEGLARVVDIGGTMVVYNDSPTPEEADRKALFSDWRTVGDDISTAVNLYAKKPAE
ncbi:hypothetical protein [Desulfobacca acetoxidans]|uniref:hypothetical protein n=1 Tax=Desulfobacca acetoxidans TaxID=60893 RepID=UPI00059E2E52|nr:hypothetical protein [Desulfobacca acetoxidans]